MRKRWRGCDAGTLSTALGGSSPTRFLEGCAPRHDICSGLIGEVPSLSACHDGQVRNRRWDNDERGQGVASGSAHAPNLEELAVAASEDRWVTEDADAHLMPHIRAACQDPRSRLRVINNEVRDSVLVVDLAPIGDGSTAPDAIRAEVFRIVGSFAEHTTLVRQRTTEAGTEFEITTGITADESPFRPHGHLVLMRVQPPE